MVIGSLDSAGLVPQTILVVNVYMEILLRNFAFTTALLLSVGACSSDDTQREVVAIAATDGPTGVGSATTVDEPALASGVSVQGAPASDQPILIVEEDPAPPLAQPGNVAEGEACQSVSEQGQPRFLPQDIILVVDNSGSMDGEAQAVQDRINVELAQILEQSGVDFRVILLSRYGKVGEEVDPIETGICIGAPLGGHDCSDPDPREDGTSGTQPLTNTERFFHYSENIESTDAWCQILNRFNQAEHADDHPGVSGEGWKVYARSEAFKSFVVITDDQVDCEFDDVEYDDENTAAGAERAAAAFDRALLALSPEQFGTSAERNYNFYSIVGVAENEPATMPWLPVDPINVDECRANDNNVETAGTGYQALSVLTGGLRYPICENGNFDAIFRAIAQGIVQGAELSCEYDIPAPPDGQVLDPNRVNLLFQPDVGDGVQFFRTPSVLECGEDGGWYYDDPNAPTRVLACPSTCDFLRAATGEVEVQFGCESKFVVGSVR